MAYLNIETLDRNVLNPVSQEFPQMILGRAERWDYVVRTYDKKGRFRLETTHRGERSLNFELAVIRSANQDADVFKIDHSNDEAISRIGSLRS